jgi:hypothetical protein
MENKKTDEQGDHRFKKSLMVILGGGFKKN